ncbi:hypothetical protein Tco_0933044 [Tanacetum coccineum]
MALSQEEFHQIHKDHDDARRRLRRTDALATCEANCAADLVVESQSKNDDDGNKGNGGRNGDKNGRGNREGNRNGNGGGSGNGNPNRNDRSAMPVICECTYQDFMKCQPLNLKGTERVVRLIRWFEKMETVFQISNCPEKYQGNVIAAEPTRLQDAVRIANNFMDQKLKGYAVKNDENKRRLEVNQRDNYGQQPPFKRQNVGSQNVVRAYTAGNNERRVYNGAFPLCNKCKFHHEGSCTMRCGKCNKVWHLNRDYYMSDCPKLKDQNRGNKTGNKSRIGEARGKAYAPGGGDANLDSNVITGTFLLNNRYASMLFDLGANRSFVSTTFSALLDVIPSTLDVSYAVELADMRISETNTVTPRVV